MKNIISTTAAPGAIGPYSQGTSMAGLVFVSGQLPVDMSTGELSLGIQAQTRTSLNNLENILKAAQCSMADVLKTTVFLTDMNDFTEMNKVYAEYFKENPPARSTVEVAGLPKDALVEIECIALKS